jgi:rRNA biogenesis protein RRP5
LPILSRFEDAEVGIVTHAVVLKVLEKNLIVGLYNGLKATIPAREARSAISFVFDQVD